MRADSFTAIALLLCSAARAQFTAVAHAHTQLLVSASGQTQSVPAGTDISAGVLLHAGSFDGAEASLVTSLTLTADAITFDVMERASQLLFSQALAGPHESRLDILTPIPLYGRFVLSWTGQAGSNGTVAAAVDIGNDGALELVSAGSSATATLPCTIPAGAFPVVVRSHVLSNQGTWLESVRVRFEVDFTATPFGVPCGAVQQTARSNAAGGVDLVTTVPAGSQGFCLQGLGISVLTAPVQIPCAPLCNLDIVPIDIRVAGVTGPEAILSLDLSTPGLRPITFAAQSAWVDTVAGTAVSSNGLGIVHR